MKETTAMDLIHGDLITTRDAPFVRLLGAVTMEDQASTKVEAAGKTIWIASVEEADRFLDRWLPLNLPADLHGAETAIWRCVEGQVTYWVLRTDAEHGLLWAVCMARGVSVMEAVAFLLGVGAASARTCAWADPEID
jgi:hypothetical protein